MFLFFTKDGIKEQLQMLIFHCHFRQDLVFYSKILKIKGLIIALKHINILKTYPPLSKMGK